MIELDGVQYEVKTPEENADDLVTFINNRCKDKQIKNSLGEEIYVDVNEANPFYQFIYGASYLTTILQKLVYNAGCASSIAEASDRQLLNLADIAGIKRIKPTKTVITGTVYADTSDMEGAAPCHIDTENTITVVIAGQEVQFNPAFDIVVPVNGSYQIVLVAKQYGSFNIAANTIPGFDDVIPHLRKLVTGASVPGHAEESIANLRERLQRRGVEGTQMDRAALAIQSLPGVAMCNIVYNVFPHDSIPLTDTITIPPRTAAVFIQGHNDKIAEVFYRYLLCTTVAVENVTIESKYVTKAGQELTVNYFVPDQVPVYATVFIHNLLTKAQIAEIKDAVCSLASVVTIGCTITAVMVTDVILKRYPDLDVQGALLSKSHEAINATSISANGNELFMFDVSNISIEGMV